MESKSLQNKEEQNRIKSTFEDNRVEIPEEEKEEWNDPGKHNEESDAGVWTIEAPKR